MYTYTNKVRPNADWSTLYTLCLCSELTIINTLVNHNKIVRLECGLESTQPTLSLRFVKKEKKVFDNMYNTVEFSRSWSSVAMDSLLSLWNRFSPVHDKHDGMQWVEPSNGVAYTILSACQVNLSSCHYDGESKRMTSSGSEVGARHVESLHMSSCQQSEDEKMVGATPGVCADQCMSCFCLIAVEVNIGKKNISLFWLW